MLMFENISEQLFWRKQFGPKKILREIDISAKYLLATRPKNFKNLPKFTPKQIPLVAFNRSNGSSYKVLSESRGKMFNFRPKSAPSLVTTRRTHGERRMQVQFGKV